jgi:Ni,Fe-hydrogenase III large subunit
LLAVAGWEAAATSARRLRDRALDGAESSVLQAAVHRIGLRVSRSRMLAWSTRGLGTLSADDASAAGVRGPALRAAGDVNARYRRWCRELAEVADRFDDDRALRPELLEPPRGWLEDVKPPSAALLAVLPGLLAGAELAAARLIVASLDPDLDELAVQVGVEHVG